MNRRGFLGLSLAAVGGIFVPKYDKWYRQGSGLLVPNGVDWSNYSSPPPLLSTGELNAAWIKVQMKTLDTYGGRDYR